MTAKDRARMRRLEIENEELRRMNDRHIEVYRENIIELIDLRATVQLLREMLCEASA